MLRKISLSVVLFLGFLLAGCGKGPDAGEITCLRNAVKGLGAQPFVITGISKYKKCELYFYSKSKAELLLKQDLKDVGDQICVAVPTSPDNKIVALGRMDGYKSTVKFSYDESLDHSGYVSMLDAPCKAAPCIVLLGSECGVYTPKPSDFSGDKWAFVVKFK